MRPARSSLPRLIWLPLLGWLAQLWLPVAHAGMAPHHLGAIWCGKATPELAAKLAELPAEVREILDPRATQTDAQALDCLFACAGSGVALALPGSTPMLTLPALPAADVALRSEPVHLPRQTAPPSTRGPPA